MKTVLITLISCAIVLAELPPPYLQRGFRPSPQLFSPSRSPQILYGPPQKVNVLDVNIPSKLTIEQLIKITEQLQHSRGKVVNRPQQFNSYLPPSRQPQRPQIRPGNISRPQPLYGPPNKQQQAQDLRPPSQVYGAPQSFGNPQSAQQNSFGAPAGQQLPSFSQPASFANPQSPPLTSYGVPLTQQLPTSFQSNNFGTLNSQSNANSQASRPPSTSYGVPLTELSSSSQSNNFAFNLQSNANSQAASFVPTGSIPQRPPSTNYGVPFNEQTPSSSQSSNFVPSNPQSQTPPSTNYGVPNIRNLETFGDFRNAAQSDRDILQQNLLNDLSKQHLPYKQPTGFRPQGNQNSGSISQDYIPSKEDSNTLSGPQIPSSSSVGSADKDISKPPNNQIGENYLPPSSTSKPVLSTTPKATVTATTLKSTPVTNYDYDYDLQQPTESPSNEDGSETGPNISISNAVAGSGGFFYLQQPDGRLQKVVLEKVKDASSKPEEYVANYYFQNIPALPQTLYSPFINLAAVTTK